MYETLVINLGTTDFSDNLRFELKLNILDTSCCFFFFSYNCFPVPRMIFSC